MSKMIFIRGLPGSGKSYFARMMETNYWIKMFYISVDNFFENEVGEYHFDGLKTAQAETWTQNQVLDFANGSKYRLERNIIIHNVFAQRWEMEPYMRIAKNHNYEMVVIDLYDGGLTNVELFARNIHGVPLQTIVKMRARWEHNWKNGDPISPWERQNRIS